MQFVVCGGFVIKEDVAQQARVVSDVGSLFNQTQGVFGRQTVGFVVPNPLKIAAQGGISAVYRTRGVKSDRRTDRTGVGVILGGVDQFTGEVGLQLALDQFGRSIQTGAVAGEFRTAQNTGFVVPSQAQAVREVFDAAGERNVHVLHHARLVDHVLPIGARSAVRRDDGIEGARTVAVYLGPTRRGGQTRDLRLGAVGVDGIGKLVGIQYIDLVAVVAHRINHVQISIECFAGSTFLGGHEDDAIRSARTVDGRGRGVLQNGKAFNIRRVDQAQAVCWETVNDY